MFPMKCNQIHMVPGEHGEGEEIPCTGQAMFLYEGSHVCLECKRSMIACGDAEESEFKPFPFLA
jgi:hypothetical protein